MPGYIKYYLIYCILVLSYGLWYKFIFLTFHSSDLARVLLLPRESWKTDGFANRLTWTSVFLFLGIVGVVVFGLVSAMIFLVNA